MKTILVDLNVILDYLLNRDGCENTVIVESAKLKMIDCIVTRNIKDFKNSDIPAMLPKTFLDKLKSTL